MFEAEGSFGQGTQGNTKIMSQGKNSEKKIYLGNGALHLSERGIHMFAFPFLASSFQTSYRDLSVRHLHFPGGK